jgi:IclR family KDG regulon transcriptional repressor
VEEVMSDLEAAGSGSKPDSVAAVLKLFAVLEALAEERTMSLADVARRAMTSKSTAYRFLQTMMDLGYVRQEGDTDKYGLTLKIFSIGAKVLNRHVDLVRVADRAMSRLAQATGEAVQLGIMDEHRQAVVYIHKCDSAYNLATQSPLGKRNPLHATSLGKALLAWLEPAEIAERLDVMTFTKLTPKTIDSRAVLEEQLAVMRRQGYAEECEESETGVRCLAAPVFNHIGRVAAAISLSFPIVRFDVTRSADYAALVRRAGREASEGLGCFSYPDPTAI